MRHGKSQISEGIELPNQVRVRMLEEKENYKYLRILEADTIEQAQMKEKIAKEYLRQTRNLLETRLCNRSLIKVINTWAVLLARYSGLFLKWTKKELRLID